MYQNIFERTSVNLIMIGGSKQRRINYLIILIGATYIWVVYQVWKSVLNAFNLNNYLIIDTSTMIQSMSSTIFNHLPFLNTVPGGTFFRVHSSPILFLLLPFYSIWPGIQSLMIIQIGLIYSATIPLYLLAVKRLKNEFAAFAIALSYLFYPAIATEPFEVVALFSALAIYSYYFIDQKQYRRFAVSFALMLSTIEFAPVVGIFFGILLLIKALWGTEFGHNILKSFNLMNFSIGRIRKKIGTPALVGILVIIVSASMFYLDSMMNVFFSAGSHSIYTNLYGTDTRNIESVLYGLTVDPSGKISNIVQLNAPYLFLSFLDPVAILQLPWFSATLVSVLSGYWTYGKYYDSFIFPFVAIGAIEGLYRIGFKGFNNEFSSFFARNIKKIAALILVMMSVSWLAAGGITDFTNPAQAVNPNDVGLTQAASIIPQNGEVFSTVNALPVLSAHVWNTWYFGQPRNYTIFNAQDGPPYSLANYGFLAASGSYMVYEKNYTGSPIMNNYSYSVSPYKESSSGAPYEYDESIYIPTGQYVLTAQFKNQTTYIVNTINNGPVIQRYFLNTDDAIVQSFQVNQSMFLNYIVINASMTYGWYGVSAKITRSLDPTTIIASDSYGTYATDSLRFNFNMQLQANKNYYLWIWSGGLPGGLYIPLTNGTGMYKTNLSTNFEAPVNNSMQFNLVGQGGALHAYSTLVQFSSSLGDSSAFNITQPTLSFIYNFNISKAGFYNFIFKSKLAYGDFTLNDITITSLGGHTPHNYFLENPYDTLSMALIPGIPIIAIGLINQQNLVSKRKLNEKSTVIVSILIGITYVVFFAVFSLGFFNIIPSLYSAKSFAVFGVMIITLIALFGIFSSFVSRKE